jgi:ribose/xylose/arabinose/galactoside ABC-type transport system permease subunit
LTARETCWWNWIIVAHERIIVVMIVGEIDVSLGAIIVVVVVVSILVHRAWSDVGIMVENDLVLIAEKKIIDARQLIRTSHRYVNQSGGCGDVCRWHRVLVIALVVVIVALVAAAAERGLVQT